MRAHGTRKILVPAAAVLLLFLLLAAAPARWASLVSHDSFTPEHRTVAEAVRDFFGWRRRPVQPIAFPHKTHLAHGLKCEGCHTTVASGPIAGIPGIKLCMSCHQLFATETPEIRKLAAYFSRGEDLNWQRVYGFSPTAHVKFNHAPHIRSGVECSSCHGDMTRQTVAVRAVNLKMGGCLTCHRRLGASTDCIACHY